MEFTESRTEFLAKYKTLIDEFKVDIMSTPIFIPDGQGGWRLVVHMDIVDIVDIVDTLEQPVKSNFPFTID